MARCKSKSLHSGAGQPLHLQPRQQRLLWPQQRLQQPQPYQRHHLLLLALLALLWARQWLLKCRLQQSLQRPQQVASAMF